MINVIAHGDVARRDNAARAIWRAAANVTVVVVALVATRSRARFWLFRDGFAEIVARLDRAPASRERLELARVCATVKRTEAVVDRIPGVGRQCLHRALGRFAALRAAGWDASLKLGVRSEGDLVGHAWIEVDGVPVLEREPPDFVVTYTSARSPGADA